MSKSVVCPSRSWIALKEKHLLFMLFIIRFCHTFQVIVCFVTLHIPETNILISRLRFYVFYFYFKLNYQSSSKKIILEVEKEVVLEATA